MELVARLIEKLQRHPKRIVFPEGEDPRVLDAARRFYCLRLGAPIVLGSRPKIEKAAAAQKIPLDCMRVIDPRESADLDGFARAFRMSRAARGMKLVECRDAMLNPNYFGAMMVAMHQADGLVTGATLPTAAVLRPLVQVLGLAPNITTATGCAVVEFENRSLGEDGVLFMADCGVVPEPSMDELADIGIATARFARHVCGFRPRVAFLSYATRGRKNQPALGKVQAAVALAAKKAAEVGLEADFDGEMQIDTALVPEVAARKLPRSRVAGRANVLVFPDLHSANIAVKLIMHLVHSRVYAAMILGLTRPAASVSRGATATEIFDAAVLVGVQAINYNLLYPGVS